MLTDNTWWLQCFRTCIARGICFLSIQMFSRDTLMLRNQHKSIVDLPTLQSWQLVTIPALSDCRRHHLTDPWTRPMDPAFFNLVLAEVREILAKQWRLGDLVCASSRIALTHPYSMHEQDPSSPRFRTHSRGSDPFTAAQKVNNGFSKILRPLEPRKTIHQCWYRLNVDSFEDVKNRFSAKWKLSSPICKKNASTDDYREKGRPASQRPRNLPSALEPNLQDYLLSHCFMIALVSTVRLVWRTGFHYHSLAITPSCWVTKFSRLPCLVQFPNCGEGSRCKLFLRRIRWIHYLQWYRPPSSRFSPSRFLSQTTSGAISVHMKQDTRRHTGHSRAK